MTIEINKEALTSLALWVLIMNIHYPLDIEESNPDIHEL